MGDSKVVEGRDRANEEVLLLVFTCSCIECSDGVPAWPAMAYDDEDSVEKRKK